MGDVQENRCSRLLLPRRKRRKELLFVIFVLVGRSVGRIEKEKTGAWMCGEFGKWGGPFKTKVEKTNKNQKEKGINRSGLKRIMYIYTYMKGVIRGEKREKK